MKLVNRARTAAFILATSAFVGLAAPSQAQDTAPSGTQEIAESHLKAGRAAIAAIHATDLYDRILPQAAQALKKSLIEQNPDLEALITATVDEKTLLLAGRRADLEKEAANAYARAFSEPELTAIAAFYNSDPGKKLLSQGPIVNRDINKAVQIWQNGVARDLADSVGKQLASVVKSTKAQTADDAPTPAAGTEPAEGTDPAAAPAQ